MLTDSRLKVRLTGFGKIAAFLAIFLLFSAQNTGNNLLFLMSSCFIAAVTFFTLLGYLNLKGLQARVELPDSILAGEEIFLKCFVKDVRNADHFSLGFENDYCKIVEAGDGGLLKSSFKAGKRGVYQLSDFCIFSFYPIGLCSTSLVLPEKQFFVGPRAAKNIPHVIEQEIGGAIQKYQSGKEGEYWMQKQYEPGEDASLINWMISARSDHEWVLTRAVNYGFPEKLYFDFTGLEGQLFEDCLEIVMGLILRLRKAGSSAFVWAKQSYGGYAWLTVSDNYADLVSWLACLESTAEVPPPAGEFSGIRFCELMKVLD